jgi:hypothetical protein
MKLAGHVPKSVSAGFGFLSLDTTETVLILTRP